MSDVATSRLPPDDKLLGSIRWDIRQGDFKGAKFIADLTQRPQAAEALLTAIEQEWIWQWEAKQKKYPYGYMVASKPEEVLKEVCEAVTHPRFAADRSRSAGVLARLYRSVDVSSRSYRRVLSQALGRIADEGMLPDLIFELSRDRQHVEESSNHYSYDSSETALNGWRETRSEALKRFPDSLVENITHLLSKFNYLKQRSERRYGQQMSERARFVLRSEIIDLLRAKPNLLNTCLYFLLWKYGEIEDDVTIVLSATIKPEQSEQLQYIAKTDADREVRLRARVILSHLDGSFAKQLVPHASFGSITHALAYYDSVLNSRGKAYKGYTWLEDETIEGILHTALSSADERFSKDYVIDHERHEQAHTADLLKNIRQEFEPLTELIHRASEKLASGPITIGFAYRDTQPQEKDWDADLAFQLNCFVKDKIVKRHAILVQSKKMNHNGKEFMFSWQVVTQQCHDLISKSQSSYYFLYGPDRAPSNRILVVPASALFGIIKATGMVGEKTVHFDKIKRVNRSLADFLLYDFIGCWTGDERDEIVGFAEGTDTSGPPARYVVEINIRQTIDQQ
jgi:hypothetical protein